MTQTISKKTRVPGQESRWYRWARRAAGILTGCHLVFLGALWLATFVIGERNVTSAYLIYLPPMLWLLPGLFLLPFNLCVNLRAAAWFMLGVLLWTWGWAGFRLGPEAPRADASPEPGRLIVMTYNRGQHGGHSFQPFKNAIQPDVICMQEAGSRASNFKRDPGYAEFPWIASAGEHTCLSRFPIAESTLVPAALESGSGVSRAARFVVDWEGEQVAVYSVHLHSPRDVLRSQSRGGFLLGVFGIPRTPLAEKRRSNQRFWDVQIADATQVLEVVRGDPLPVVVVGDFNAPHVGWISRQFQAHLQDAHQTAGSGFGFTFPGTTRNPLSLGGPWLRIDYIFADPAWEVLDATTEPDRASQHRAVAATLRLKK